MRGIIVSVVAPLWQTENLATARVASVGNFFRSKGELIEENKSLRERVNALELEIATRSSRAAEATEMLELMGREVETGGIVSTVLMRPPQTPYDALVIDVGSRDAIQVASAVSMPEGPVLGVVSHVYLGSSRVKLLTSPGEQTAAVLERHGLPVTLEGIGGGNFRIVLPREAEVEVGDRILSADVSSRLMGVVGSVQMEQTDSFKEVLAKSPVNIFNVHYVIVRP